MKNTGEKRRKKKGKKEKKSYRSAARCAAACIAAALLFAGCAGEETTPADGRLKICAALFPQYDFAREIAGDLADVSLLLPPGADSHTFDPSMKDIVQLQSSDLFLYTGGGLEPWSEAFVKNAPESCRVCDVAEGIPPLSEGGSLDDGKNTEDAAHNADPHVFTSPKNAMTMAENICRALCGADPENAEAYEKNAEAYLARLQALDEAFAACATENTLEPAQEKGRQGKLYFAGEFAFLYLMKAYDFPYLSLFDVCSEHAEPNAKRLSEMVSALSAQGGGIVFYAEPEPCASARTVASETGAELRLLHSCHNLTAEELEAGKTYLTVMQENLEQIREALSWQSS